MSSAAGQQIRDKARDIFKTLPDPIQLRVLHALHRRGPWNSGSAPEAPAAPIGMSVAPPDFVGVGVPKCGTTWWFSLVMAHPEIHVQNQKELLFFNKSFFRHVNDVGASEEDLEAYRRWFPRPAGTISGEWTPNYVFFYQLPPILKAAAPDAKLLVMVRDPVERYRSDISRRTSRKRLNVVRYRGMARGFYSAALQPWEAAFDPSEILLLQFETCLQSPVEMLEKTFRFLGVDETFRPPEIRTPVNKTKVKRTIDPNIERLLVQLYEPDVVALTTRYPQIDLSVWPNFSHLANRHPSPEDPS